MLTALLTILIVALVLIILYWLLGKLCGGVPLQVIGVILALILLLFALKKLGLTGSLGL